MPTATHNPMTIEDFHATKEFLALTERQRKWVDVFIETADANHATLEAYNATDSVYRAMLCRKVETSPRVIAALDLFYGRSPKEKFPRDLELEIVRESCGTCWIAR